MDAWKRKQMHSHVYRVPEPFRNEVSRPNSFELTGDQFLKSPVTDIDFPGFSRLEMYWNFIPTFLIFYFACTALCGAHQLSI